MSRMKSFLIRPLVTLKSHSRLWMSLRFGLPIETYRNIDTWSGRILSTTISSTILREAAAHLGLKSMERRSSVVQFFLKRYGKRHVARGNISQTMLEAIIALQIAIDDIRTGILYMPDCLRNVCTFEQLHQLFGGSRIEAPGTGMVYNAFLSFSAFFPISEDFEICKDALMEAWNQRLALYYPNGGPKFDIVLPCILPTRANIREQLFQPITPDINDISFVSIQLEERKIHFSAGSPERSLVNPVAAITFKESNKEGRSLPNINAKHINWYFQTDI